LGVRLTCSNAALAELTTGSNTPLTDSTDLRLTMQHNFGTASIWRDKAPSPEKKKAVSEDQEGCQ